jgi:hypothetical protein
MPLPTPAALVGSPFQWATLALLIVVIFAPSLVPRLGRQAGRLLRAALLRRLGIPQSHPQTTRPKAEAQVLPPEHPAPTLRAGAKQPIQQRPARLRPTAVWPRVVLVAAAATVLLWYLLHPR